MSGSASGNVSIAGSSNDSFTGNYSVSVGGGVVKVSGTGDQGDYFRAVAFREFQLHQHRQQRGSACEQPEPCRWAMAW